MPDERGPETVYRFGEFELVPRERKLTRNGERVALTPRMFDLLLALVEADGHLLSKDMLLETVWADAAVEEGNLNRTISALRKVLGEKRNENRFIETVPKAGYRFVGKVERRPNSRPMPAPAEPAGKHARKFPFVAAVGAFVVLFGMLVVSYVVFSNSRRSTDDDADTPTIVRLTSNGFDEDSAAWTNDEKIRFIRFTALNRVESMIMNSDGSGQQRDGGAIRDLRAGTWSPDGKHVIYSKDGENPRTPFIASADGSNERRLDFPIGPMDWSPDSRKIVYCSNFGTPANDSELFLYDMETGERRNLSNNPAFDANPSFSPDGLQIIFNSDRDGNSEIYSINIDGSGLRRLTNDPAKEAFQAFSPDGTQIVFNSNRENEKVGIFLLNVNDPSSPLKLSDTKHNAEIRPGCWSRDGTKIVYMSDAGGEKYNIYSMTVEPARPKRIVADGSGDIIAAAISPDGERFALAIKTEDGHGELRLLERKSGRVQGIVEAENSDLSPSWSPDGRKIAFAMKAEGNTEIFSINADGSGLTNLSQNPSRDASPSWSPDGTRIVFSSDREARSERNHLFVMNVDGNEPRRFSLRDGFEMTPAWSRDGKMLVYACDRNDGSTQALDIVTSPSGDQASETVVTRLRFHDVDPEFSPDGRRIVFSSQSDGNAEIYLVNIDGSGLVRLTRNTRDDLMPVFSPDGSTVYFVSNRTGKFALYEMGVGM